MFWQLTFKRQSHIFDVTEQVAAWFQSFNTKNISVHKYPLFIRVFWKYLRRFNVGGRIILFLTVLCFTSLKTVLLMKFTLLFSTMISLLMCLQHKQSRPETKTKKLHVYMDEGFRLRHFFFFCLFDLKASHKRPVGRVFPAIERLALPFPPLCASAQDKSRAVICLSGTREPHRSTRRTAGGIAARGRWGPFHNSLIPFKALMCLKLSVTLCRFAFLVNCFF